MYPLLEEIWIEIFSYLDPYTRQNIVRLVCKDWLRIKRSDSRLSGHLKIKQIIHYTEINSMLRNNWPKLKVGNLINNPRMFNGVLFDLAEEPYIPQKILLQ